MSVSFFNSDDKFFWRHYMGGLEGDVPEPEHVYVSPSERWSPASPWYLLREELGRHRCPACGKPYFFRSSAWNCHPAASAYKLWKRFAHKGPAGARSLADAIRAEVSNPYSSLGGGYYGGYGGGGPFGL